MTQETHIAAPEEAAALIELYFEKGWTDGLPVIPPSEASVNAMITASGFDGDTVVGEVEVRNTQITANKVAINAVMAGCLPEYMPVVVSAVIKGSSPLFKGVKSALSFYRSIQLTYIT